MSDFVVKVRSLVDKASFSQGVAAIEKLEQSAKSLVKGITGISAAVIGSATIAGNVAQEELKMARSIGVSSEALSSWKVACNVAGASANGLIGALSSLETKMQHLKTGTVDLNLAKNLGMLGVGYGDFADMDSETRMRTVFNQANQMEDQQLAATLVGDVLGQAGKDYYESLKMSGKSLSQQLAEAKKLNFVTNQQRKEAAVFATEVKGIKEAGKSIAMSLGSELARALTPTARKIKNYLIENRDKIQRGIKGIGKAAETIINGVAGVIEKVAPFVQGLIDKFGGLDKVIVKVALGFASMKLVKVVGGIRQLISGVGLLKTAFGGLTGVLLGGAISKIFEDIMSHFEGGNSGIFDILIPKIKILKKELGFDDTFNDLKKSLQSAWETAKGLFKTLGDIVLKLTGCKNGAELFTKALETALGFIKGVADLIGAVSDSFTEAFSDDEKEKAAAKNRNFQRGKQTARKFAMVDYGQIDPGSLYNRSSNLDENKVRQWAEDKYVLDAMIQEERERRGKKWYQDMSAEEIMNSSNITLVKYYKSYVNKYGGLGLPANIKNAPKPKQGALEKVNDGIIQPGGKVTQVSPDDWVFAVKNVQDLAGALMPSAVSNYTNATAPTNYVINQTFSVERGMNPAAFKTAAYKGTVEAMQNNFSNAARIVQLMPGVR